MNLTLEHRLKRLMLFRVVMVTTLLLVAIYVESVSETLLAVNPLYFLIVATYVLTLAYAGALRYVRSYEKQVEIQVTLDLLIITGLVYLTGGGRTQAGFMLLYPISVLSASVLLYRRRGVTLAGVAVVFYGALLWAVRSGRIPPAALVEIPRMPVQQVLYSVFVTGVSCVTVALIGSYLSESLRTVGEQLEEASVEVADLRELHQVVVNSMHSGLIIADVAGRIRYLNAFGESILGARSAEVMGRTLRDVFGSVLFEPAALEARTVHDLSRLETPYAARDGQRLELGVSVSPLITGDPARRGYLLVFQNLTHVKELEREVRLKERLAAVGEMAAQLAHEIRNPLGSISGSAQMLLGEPNISAEQGRLLAIITKESKRLSETLSQFLFQTRRPEPRTPVDLGAVVTEAVTLLRNSPEVGPQHRVTFEASGGPYMCLADPDQITQLFWNLTRNALEAMTGGGTLAVRLSSSEENVLLRIRDEGRGIAADEQRNVFEPFRTGSRAGTGLGLAIVYRIVRDHWGDISIRSTPGAGTEVEVRFPRLRATATA